MFSFLSSALAIVGAFYLGKLAYQGLVMVLEIVAVRKGDE